MLEQEFKKYIKNFASASDYDICNEEIEKIYRYFFDDDLGIINSMMRSQILDCIYNKYCEIKKEFEKELEK